MNLSVYLSELLKTNDCVIVPDLGGFIANYQSSGYDVQGDQFFPPAKEIIFSNKIKKNDGLLVNHVAEKEGVGYLEARKIVSEIVSEILFKLENGERIEFERIGTLYIDPKEHLLFEPSSHKQLRTDAYGLDSFHFPPLVNKYSQPTQPLFRDQTPEPQKRNRKVLKYVAIGLPLLAALYFVPIGKLINYGKSGNPTNTNTASLAVSDTPVLHNPSIIDSAHVTVPKAKSDSILPESPNEAPSQPLVTPDNVPVKPQLASETTAPEKSFEQHSVDVPPTGKYHIVGGCFKMKENAEKLASKLAAQGYHATVTPMGKGFFRVTVESYQTRREAEQGLGKILEADPETGYWLMADKK